MNYCVPLPIPSSRLYYLRNIIYYNSLPGCAGSRDSSLKNSPENLCRHILNLSNPRELRLLSDAYAHHQDEPEYRNFMNIIIRANLTAQKGKNIMCEALYELFAPQLKEQWEDGKNQGIELGEQRINQLNAALARDNRSDELLRSFTDPVLQTSLLKEYHLL